MKTIKVVSALALIFSLSYCGSSKSEKNGHIQIDSKEYYNWVGNLPGVSGTNVEIKLKHKTKIVFDSLYFKGKSSKAKVLKGNLIIANYTTSRKNNTDIILHSDPVKEFKNKIPKQNKFPFILNENDAVLSYQFSRETRYVKIKDIKKVDKTLN